MKLRHPALVCLCAAIGMPPEAGAQPGRFDLGVRGVLMAADGEPANDIPGGGLFGHYRLNDRWSLGFALDQAEYDFEEPAKIAGIEQDPNLDPIDVLAESTTISAWLERTYRRSGGPTTWFWGVGAGIASIDVPDAAGPRRNGGRFDIHTEVDSELVASVSAGVRRDLGRRLFAEFALRADQHFAKWELTDRVSGARATVEDYLALGGHLGVGFRF